MELYQIILLILGIVIFVLSFIIPEKAGASFDRRKTEHEVKELLDGEVKKAIDKLENQADETVGEAVNRAERSLERISNEKIMAVNEYSDTVLTDIHKNHEEVVFLYSMLDDKHTNLKETVANVEQTTRDVQSTMSDMVRLRNTTEELIQNQFLQAEQQMSAYENQPESENLEAEIIQPVTESVSDDVVTDNVESGADEEEPTIEQLVLALEEFSQQPVKAERTVKKTSDTKKTKSKTRKNSKELPEIQTRDANGNHNDTILRLHREGKSNVAIAKELGLGVGEVKLVIDLFRQG